uniref:Uncharacterized protein n=1 Tax=Daphnia galeata TaxID=27404 RepID=A0A8J2RYQ9_9CRUS|nr:unnamed protein product [Daphnia galeata]
MRSPLSMMVAFSTLWLVSVTATPVHKNLDKDSKSTTDFIAGLPLTEEMKGNFSGIGEEFIEDFYPWEKQDPTLHEGDIQFSGTKMLS